jgi:hypothetical protein
VRGDGLAQRGDACGLGVLDRGRVGERAGGGRGDPLAGQAASGFGAADGLGLHHEPRIVLDCSAVDAQALFVGAVLAFPATWRRRAIGAAAGLLALFAGVQTVRAADGDLDPTFGVGGQVMTAFGALDTEAYTIMSDGSGSFVVAAAQWSSRLQAHRYATKFPGRADLPPHLH